MRTFLVFLMLLSLCSCGLNYKYTTDKSLATKPDYTIEITPTCNGQVPKNQPFNSFLLTIVNNTDADMQIIWNETMYIRNGQSNGGFMFEGVVYKDRNAPKPNDFIFPGRFTKTIWPNNLVEYSQFGWLHGMWDAGEHGVYLTLEINGKKVREKLTTTLY